MHIDAKIVFCTQKTIEESTFATSNSRLPIVRSATLLNLPFKGFFENKEGIGTCYNKFINDSIQNPIKCDFEWIIFAHDDIFIGDVFLEEKLNQNKDRFDIIGIAGSAEFNINRSPITWINCAKDKIAGSVEHPVNDKSEKSLFYISSYGPSPRRVAIIDGCFIAVKKNILFEKNLKFEENFKFNFYDADFCLNANIKGLRIGVVNIHCTHLSQGAGLRSEQYKIDESMFIQKWRKNEHRV